MTNIQSAYKCDVLVVGARCAGAATAMLLARQGARVLLVDRAAEGSDTLSTHALMRGAVMQLNNWGILPAIAAEGTPPIRQTSFIYGDGPAIDIELSESHGTRALYAPRRTVLDKQLVLAARAAGVTTRFGVSLARLVKGRDGGVKGAVLRDRHGEYHVDCEQVVGADGRDSLVAREAGAGLMKRGTNASHVVYGYFSGLSSQAYRWYWGDGCGGGIIPTNDGLSCVFLSAKSGGSINLKRAMTGEKFQAALDAYLPKLGSAMQGASLSGRMTGFVGEVGHLREACGHGWALVGDAGYFKDPITAHGITDALRDAQILADAWARGRIEDYSVQRDALSRDILRISDQIAAYDWSMSSIANLHKSLNIAMQANQQWIADNLYHRQRTASVA